MPWSKFPFRDPSERIARVNLLNVIIIYLGWLRIFQNAFNDKPRNFIKV